MLRIGSKVVVALVSALAMHVSHGMTKGDATTSARQLGDGMKQQIKDGVNSTTLSTYMPAAPAARDCMPNHSVTEGYFGGGNGDLATPSSGMITSASTGNSPECDAIKLVHGQSSTANPMAITATDPLVVNAKSVTGSPEGTLGTTMNLFTVPGPTSSCAPMPSGGGVGKEEVCYEYAAPETAACEANWKMSLEPWWGYACQKTPYLTYTESCTKTEAPNVSWSQACVPGTNTYKQVDRWGGPPGGKDQISVRAYCEGNAGDPIHFQMHAWGNDGSCGHPPINFYLPRSIPADIGVSKIDAGGNYYLNPDWGSSCRFMPVEVTGGSGCTGDTCQYTFRTGENAEFVCPSGGTLTFLISIYPDRWDPVTAGWMGISNYNPLAVDSVYGLGTCAVLQPYPAGGCPAGTKYAELHMLCFSETCPPPTKYCVPDGGLSESRMDVISGVTVTINFPAPGYSPNVTENTLSTCGSIEGNGLCTTTGSSCVEGVNETRIINGHPITKACWKTENSFSCKTAGGPNYCDPLAAEASCAQLGVEGCAAYGPDGTCSTYNATYRCTKDMGAVPNITQTGTGYTIKEDYLDTAQCDGFTSNPNCTLVNSTCVDSADKTFYGFTFSRTCWKYNREYSCLSAGQSSCQGLIDEGCTEVPSATVCTDMLPNGDCATKQKLYQCGSPVVEADPDANTCDATPYCFNGICYDTSRPSDPDFGKTVAAMEVAREIGTYIDPNTHEIFRGVKGQCRKKMFGLNNCCKTPSSGDDWSNAAFYAAQSYGRYYMGSTYTFDGLFSGDGVNWMGLATQAAGLAISGATTASIYGITIGWSGGSLAVVGFDPTSMAIAIAVQLVLTELTSCPASDQNTAMKKAQGICHFVGSYCSSKTLGICNTRKESYCCFNSKIAKAITVQGKAQLGKNMGTAKRPNCSGLSITEVENLDFSLIDFSDFIADVAPNPLTMDQAKTSVANRLANYSPVAPAYQGTAGPPGSPPPPVPPPPEPPEPPELLEPTINASWSPNPVVAGGMVTLTVNAANAETLTFDCSGAWNKSASLPPASSTSTFAIPVGPTGTATCLFTAMNADYDVTTQADLAIGLAAPTITASFTPSTVEAGESYSFKVTSNNVDEVTYSCVGRSASGSLPTGVYSSPSQAALASEIGTVDCTFTGKQTSSGVVVNAGATQVVTTVTPTISATAPGGTVTAGAPVVMNVTTTKAASASYSCTGAVVASGSLATPSATLSVPTSASTMGTMVCQLTATSASGEVASVTKSVSISP